MRKVLKVIIIIIICLILTSLSSRILQDKGELAKIHRLKVTEDNQALNEIVNQIDNYRPKYTSETYIKTMSLVSKCMDNLIIDYDRLSQLITNGDNKISVKVTSVDLGELVFTNTLSTNYTNYEQFLAQVNVNFIDQLDDYLDDISRYTYEHEITAAIDKSDTDNIIVTLDDEDLETMNNYFYTNLLNRYQEYMNNPDIQGVSFIKTLEEISAEELYNYINNNNPNVLDSTLTDLYTAFVNQYISNIEITSVVFANNEESTVLPSDANKLIIDYNSQDGLVIFENSINTLLDEYVSVKQTSTVKVKVIEDMVYYVNSYTATETDGIQSKQIVLDDISLTNNTAIVDKVMVAMAEDLLNNMKSLGSMVEEKWQLLNNAYFYQERQIGETTQMYTAFNDAEYRVLEIKSDLDFDSYIKIHSYNSQSNTTGNTVYSAYIKSNSSITTSLPEGDYVFRYATGEVWYGEVYMFSNAGQYASVSNVLSFHEPYKKTTIILGKLDGSNPNTSGLSPEDF